MYWIIGPGGFIGYCYYGLSVHFDGKIMPKYHHYTGPLAAFIAFFCYAKACATPPGIINK